MENFKALFDLTKLPTKFFLLFSLVSSFILFAKENLLLKLHLTELNTKYGWIIGLVFIVCSGLVTINFIIWIFDTIDTKIQKRKYTTLFKESLTRLDIHEKSLIREFFINNQSSIKMPIDDPIVSGLLKKKILIINKQFGNSFILSGYNASLSLNPIANKVLTLENIDLTQNPTEEEKQFILANRPKWIDGWRI